MLIICSDGFPPPLSPHGTENLMTI